jgi:hypothetical protein
MQFDILLLLVLCINTVSASLNSLLAHPAVDPLAQLGNEMDITINDLKKWSGGATDSNLWLQHQKRVSTLSRDVSTKLYAAGPIDLGLLLTFAAPGAKFVSAIPQLCSVLKTRKPEFEKAGILSEIKQLIEEEYNGIVEINAAFAKTLPTWLVPIAKPVDDGLADLLAKVKDFYSSEK